jgi:hypothetical protein
MGNKKLLSEIDRNRELMGLNPINESYEDLPKIVDTYPNITFANRTKNDRLPKNLLDDIQNAASRAGITVQVDWAKTGHKKNTESGNLSRHSKGTAVDISHVNGKGWSDESSAKSKGIYDGIENFVSYLKSKGYKINSESGNEKAVLYFGFDRQHGNHIHVSNQSNVPSVDSGSEDDDDDSTQDNETENIPIWDIKGQIKKKGQELTQKIIDFIKNGDFLDFDK